MHEKSIPPIVSVSRTAATALALLGCAAALVTHLGALHTSGLDPVSSPIGALGRTADAAAFRYGLWLFALGHLALVFLLNRPEAGRFARGAQLFLLLDAALIAWLPWHFARVSATAPVSEAAVGPLWLLGGGVGFAMTCAAVALWRHHRSTALLTLVCLLLWTALAPVFLVIDPSWIGAYQRFVGVVLLGWTAILAVRIGLLERPRSRRVRAAVGTDDAQRFTKESPVDRDRP